MPSRTSRRNRRRARFGNTLHVNTPPQGTSMFYTNTPLDLGALSAKLLGLDDVADNGIENPTDQQQGPVKVFLPDGWVLAAANIQLTDGTNSFGPFPIAATAVNELTITVNSNLPDGVYLVVGTPVRDEQNNDKPIRTGLTVQVEDGYADSDDNVYADSNNNEYMYG